MISAPIAATDMSISIEKGDPANASAEALRANGRTPIATAAIKAHAPYSGKIKDNIYAAPIKSPVPMTCLPFMVCHQR